MLYTKNRSKENNMKHRRTTTGLLIIAGLFSLMLNGCAGETYNPGYNSYQTQNDRKINHVLQEEVNSLSDKDIAQLNKLK